MHYRNNITHREIIEDICEGCDRYCTLKEIVLMSGLGDRNLEQIKCIEIFKHEKSRQEKRKVGWEEAHKYWVSEGYAEKFAKIYKEGMKHNKLYSLIMEKHKK